MAVPMANEAAVMQAFADWLNTSPAGPVCRAELQAVPGCYADIAWGASERPLVLVFDADDRPVGRWRYVDGRIEPLPLP